MYTSHDEHALIARAKQGHRSAWAELYERHRSAILGLCRRYTRDEALAEDHCQETFLKALVKISTYRAESAFETWLGAIAVNDVLATKRRRQPVAYDPRESERTVDEPTLSSEGDLAFPELLDVLRPRRRPLATKLEQHRQFIEDGTWDDLDEGEKKKFRRNLQLVKQFMAPDVLNRRSFLAVAASLHAGGIRSADGLTQLRTEELDELVNHVKKRRADGEVLVCRAVLDRAWDALPPRLTNAVGCTPGQAEVLLRAIDLQIALSLDAFDMQACSEVLLPRMRRLVPCLTGFSQVGWERRFFQNSARLHFHQEDFGAAVQFAKMITGEVPPRSLAPTNHERPFRHRGDHDLLRDRLVLGASGCGYRSGLVA
jgi:RNA polymerase sigma factor (sigma-70 family)